MTRLLSVLLARFSRRSLRAAFILACVPSLTLVLAGLGYLQYSVQKGRLLTALEAAVDSASTRLSVNLGDSIWNMSREPVYDNLLVEMGLQDLVGIVVRNDAGKVIAAVARQNGKPVPVTGVSALPASPLSKPFRISRANKLVATGEIFYQKDDLARRLRDQWIATLCEIVAADTILTSMLFFFLSALVTLPIQRLTRMTGEIARTRDLDQKVETNFIGEVGQLARTFEQMVQKLQIVPMTVQELTGAVGDLTQIISGSTEVTQQQASGLAQASATMQEIRVASSTTSAKAMAVIEVAKHADDFSAAGQTAVENSIKSLEEIQVQIEQLVKQIGELSERTHQAGSIVETVKDLADQSNILALNASIEAVRAGEAGKGFEVVAREIRSLADQSIRATGNIRQILSEIEHAIHSTVAISDQGKAIMDRSMGQIRASGESLREMTAVVSESTVAVLQIAASVSEQDVGIAQMAEAIEALSVSMEKASSGIRLAEQAATRLSGLSESISQSLTAAA